MDTNAPGAQYPGYQPPGAPSPYQAQQESPLGQFMKSPEERAFIKKHESQATRQRGLPGLFIGGLGAWFAIKRGIIKPKSGFTLKTTKGVVKIPGAGVIAAFGMLGYFLGKMSYFIRQQYRIDMLNEIPNSAGSRAFRMSLPQVVQKWEESGVVRRQPQSAAPPPGFAPQYQQQQPPVPPPQQPSGYGSVYGGSSPSMRPSPYSDTSPFPEKRHLPRLSENPPYDDAYSAGFAGSDSDYGAPSGFGTGGEDPGSFDTSGSGYDDSPLPRSPSTYGTSSDPQPADDPYEQRRKQNRSGFRSM